MTNEADSNDASRVPPSTPSQNEGRADPNSRTVDSEKTAQEMRREFRWFEVASIVINGALAVIGVIALCIYNGQLGVMHGQLGEIIRQYPELQKSADAAKEASETAHDTMVLSQRPWVKIKHRIVKPLTFDVMRGKGPVAIMVVEDTVENVGQSIALNVFSWEDVIPLNGHGIETAKARQNEWCEANRNRKAGGLSGYMLFPRDPFVQNSTVGPFMEAVNKAANASPGDLHGKTAFVLVGCVVYRSSFEPPTAPAHETKFIYWLGEPLPNAGIQPYVIPHGVANKLQLIEFPDGFSPGNQRHVLAHARESQSCLNGHSAP